MFTSMDTGQSAIYGQLYGQSVNGQLYSQSAIYGQLYGQSANGQLYSQSAIAW